MRTARQIHIDKSSQQNHKARFIPLQTGSASITQAPESAQPREGQITHEQQDMEKQKRSVQKRRKRNHQNQKKKTERKRKKIHEYPIPSAEQKETRNPL